MNSAFARAATLAGAAALEATLSDPPNAAHPVVLIGRLAAIARRYAPESPGRRRLYGVAMALVLPSVAAGISHLVQRVWPAAAGGTLGAGALIVSVTTSRRTLLLRAREVAQALEADDLPEARRLLAYHLVSRDTADLTTSEVAAATIESVAENLHDGVLAPWCATALGGAPASVAYRTLNTLDSMWGYHEPFLEELGMGAARLDDLVNLLPARLSAACIVLAAVLHGTDHRTDAARALRTWRDHAGRTASPNAGHPMAAMAGALRITLTKRDHYTLGEGRDPAIPDIERACVLADTAATIALSLLISLLLAKAAR